MNLTRLGFLKSLFAVPVALAVGSVIVRRPTPPRLVFKPSPKVDLAEFNRAMMGAAERFDPFVQAQQLSKKRFWYANIPDPHPMRFKILTRS